MAVTSPHPQSKSPSTQSSTREVSIRKVRLDVLTTHYICLHRVLRSDANGSLSSTSELFVERQKYGLKVQEARNKSLRDYVANIVSNVQQEILKASRRPPYTSFACRLRSRTTPRHERRETAR